MDYNKISAVLSKALKPIVSELESVKEANKSLKEQLEMNESNVKATSKDVTESRIEKLLDDPSKDLSAIKNIIGTGDHNMINKIPEFVKGAMENNAKLSFDEAVQQVNNNFKAYGQKIMGTYKAPEPELKIQKDDDNEKSSAPKMTCLLYTSPSPRD